MNTAKYIGAFAFVALLAACSTEDDLGGNTMGNVVEINASIGEKGIFTRSNPLGDESEQKAFNTNDQISVSKNGESVVYTFDGESWKPEDGKFLCWEDGKQTFNAYYPLICKKNSPNSYEKGYLSSNQNSLDNLIKSDYMTVSTQESMPSDRKLSLSFERKTARVVIKATSFGTQFGEGANPYIYEVNVFSQQNVPSKTSGFISQITAYCMEGKSKQDRVFYALVSPDAAHSDKQFLQLDVSHTQSDGTTHTDSYNVTGIPAHEAGKSYTYNLRIGKDKVTIESVTVEDWKTGDVIPGGDAVTLVEAVTKTIEDALARNETAITLALPTNPGKEVFAAITKALSGADKIDLVLNGVETLCTDAFLDCSQLKSINLPNVKSIGQSAFYGCYNMEAVNAPNATSISDLAFMSCSRLRKVVLGNISKAGTEVLKNCDTRNSIDLELSGDQKMLSNKYTETVWEPDYSGENYKNSIEHLNCDFLGYRFKSIRCGDKIYSINS